MDASILTPSQKETIAVAPYVALEEAHYVKDGKVTHFRVQIPDHKYFITIEVRVNIPKSNWLTEYRFFILVGKLGGIKSFRKSCYGYESVKKGCKRSFWSDYYRYIKLAKETN
jgi:hypothetical protein